MRRIIDKKVLARCRIRGKRIIRSRLSVLMSVFLITGGILALRLTYVQGVSHNRYMEMGLRKLRYCTLPGGLFMTEMATNWLFPCS